MRTLILISVCALVALFTSGAQAQAQAPAQSPSGAPLPPCDQTPLEFIRRNRGLLGTLYTAIIAADLADVLDDPNFPYTILAPIDASWEIALRKFNVSEDELLANKDLLTDILTYHVLDGSFRDLNSTVGSVDDAPVVFDTFYAPYQVEAVRLNRPVTAFHRDETLAFRAPDSNLASNYNVYEFDICQYTVYPIRNVLIPQNLTPEEVSTQST